MGLERIIHQITESGVQYFHVVKVGLKGHEQEAGLWLPGRNPFPRFSPLNILKFLDVEAKEDPLRRVLFGVAASKENVPESSRRTSPFVGLKNKVPLEEIDVFFILWWGGDPHLRADLAQKGIHGEDVPLNLQTDFDLKIAGEMRWPNCEDNIFDWHGQIPKHINLWNKDDHLFYALVLRDFHLVRWEDGCWDFSGAREISSDKRPKITLGSQNNPNVFQVKKGAMILGPEIFEVAARAKLVCPFITQVWRTN